MEIRYSANNNQAKAVFEELYNDIEKFKTPLYQRVLIKSQSFEKRDGEYYHIVELRGNAKRYEDIPQFRKMIVNSLKDELIEKKNLLESDFQVKVL